MQKKQCHAARTCSRGTDVNRPFQRKMRRAGRSSLIDLCREPTNPVVSDRGIIRAEDSAGCRGRARQAPNKGRTISTLCATLITQRMLKRRKTNAEQGGDGGGSRREAAQAACSDHSPAQRTVNARSGASRFGHHRARDPDRMQIGCPCGV